MIVVCINVKIYLIFSFLQESINSVLDLSYFRGKIFPAIFQVHFVNFCCCPVIFVIFMHVELS